MEMTRLTSLAPKPGQEKPLSESLRAAHGMAWPEVNRATGKEGARAVWFGKG
jgi:sarcosine oxidase subunit gamma